MDMLVLWVNTTLPFSGHEPHTSTQKRANVVIARPGQPYRKIKLDLG